MGHNLMQTSDGRHAYIGREAAWHKLGTIHGRHLTSAEMIEGDSPLNFDVVKDQLFDSLGRPVNAWGTFRIDPGSTDPIFLGGVGSDYTVIHHREGFKMGDALIASANGGAHWETAGALGNGERVWGQVDLGLVIRVAGVDEVKSYLSFMTAHDGSLSHQYRTVNTRTVCANTWAAAIGEKTKAKMVIRHTKNAGDRLAQAHEALQFFRDDVSSVEEKLNFLTTRKVTRESLTGILDRIFPKTRKEKDGEFVEESSTRRDGVLAEIVRLYEMNDGNAFPEFRGSSYNLFNAIVEHTDHLRNPNGETLARAESAMFGSGDTLKSKTFEVIMKAANDMPVLATRHMAHGGNGSTGSSVLDALVEASTSN